MCWVMAVLDREVDEQVLDLVTGQGDQVTGTGCAGVFLGSNDREGGMGEHRQGDPAGPGREAADLVFVEAGQALLGLERLLHTAGAD